MLHIDRLERYWLLAIAGVLGSFLAALVASVFVFGVTLPTPAGRVDPTNLQASEFARPGLAPLGEQRYTAHIVAKMWSFDVGQPLGQPAEIRVPRGSEVTFYVTSQDVTHGFQIERHNVNLMLLPGQISRATVLFDRPGTFYIICHEYCGPGHQNMTARIIVEE